MKKPDYVHVQEFHNFTMSVLVITWYTFNNPPPPPLFVSQYQKCNPLLVQSQTEIRGLAIREEMLAELRNLTHR
jgi:hypothetical protein